MFPLVTARQKVGWKAHPAMWPTNPGKGWKMAQWFLWEHDETFEYAADSSLMDEDVWIATSKHIVSAVRLESHMASTHDTWILKNDGMDPCGQFCSTTSHWQFVWGGHVKFFAGHMRHIEGWFQPHCLFQMIYSLSWQPVTCLLLNSAEKMIKHFLVDHQLGPPKMTKRVHIHGIPPA